MMKTFLCEYPFQGDRWGFEIMAADEAEAQARLKAIGWGEVSGELKMKIPAVAPNWLMIPFIRMIIYFKQLRQHND